MKTNNGIKTENYEIVTFNNTPYIVKEKTKGFYVYEKGDYTIVNDKDLKNGYLSKFKFMKDGKEMSGFNIITELTAEVDIATNKIIGYIYTDDKGRKRNITEKPEAILYTIVDGKKRLVTECYSVNLINGPTIVVPCRKDL